MTSAWPHGDPRDVVRSIVTDPRYTLRSAPHSAARSWLDVIHDWIVQLLRAIFHRIDHALGAHNSLDTLLGFALVLAAFALLAYCCYVLVRSYGRAHPRETRGGLQSQALGAGPCDANGLRAAAVVAARAGRFRDAAALLFASAIHALDERGRLAFDPARTPGEYRRIVGDPAFDALARDAVVAMFAADEPRADAFERMAGAYDRFFDPAAR